MHPLRVRQLSFIVLAFVLLSSCAHQSTPVSRSLPERGPANERQTLGGGAPLFDWPVNDARLTRGFLPKKKRPHLGLDLAAPKGTPILASRGGIVIYRGRDFRGFGKMVLIESGDGWATLYAHLDKFYVEEGERVTTGTVIGAMGRTGRATGVHLHFEIRKKSGPVDPLPLLPGGQDVAALNSNGSH